MFTSGAYTLQENTTIDVKIITAGELVVKAQYLCSMQVDTNWYWNKQPKHHVITVPIQLSSKSTSFKTFDEIHKVVLDVISDNLE